SGEEGGGVLFDPLCERAGGHSGDFLHGATDRSTRLGWVGAHLQEELDVAVRVALTSPAGDDLVATQLHEADLPAEDITEDVDPLADGESLGAGDPVLVAVVAVFGEGDGGDGGDVGVVDEGTPGLGEGLPDHALGADRLGPFERVRHEL